MYNELTKTTKSGGLRDGLIIQRKSYLGRLFRKFMDLFPQATKPTKKLLALFLIGQLYTEHFTSVRNLHKTFLSSVCDKKLNSYYHALSNDKIANTQIRQILAKMSLSIILFCELYNVC